MCTYIYIYKTAINSIQNLTRVKKKSAPTRFVALAAVSSLFFGTPFSLTAPPVLLPITYRPPFDGSRSSADVACPSIFDATVEMADDRNACAHVVLRPKLSAVYVTFSGATVVAAYSAYFSVSSADSSSNRRPNRSSASCNGADK